VQAEDRNPVAAILAGGLGTRLRAVVSDRPKPMAEIAEGRPFLDYLVSKLFENRFSRVILCVGYKRESIIRYFSLKYGARIEFSEEETSLGTAGALKNAESRLPNRFLVLNGDSHLTLEYLELLRFHQRTQSDLTMTLSKIGGRRYGHALLKGNRVLKFGKDFTRDESNLANAGVYVFEKTILDNVPENREFSLEKDLIPDLLSKGFRVMGFITENQFIDMGVPETYEYLRRNPDLLD